MFLHTNLVIYCVSKIALSQSDYRYLGDVIEGEFYVITEIHKIYISTKFVGKSLNSIQRTNTTRHSVRYRGYTLFTADRYS